MTDRSAGSSRTVLLAGYDGTSRVPGTSLGAEPLWAALRQLPSFGEGARALSLKEQTKSSAMWCRRIRRAADAQPIDLALGGEHLVTFPLVEAQLERRRDLRLVVFDAHHDAYDYPLLTHYTLFHYTQHELKVPTLIVGARHELDRAPPGCEIVSAEEVRATGLEAVQARVHRFIEGVPFYLSVDLDVLDPEEFPAVSDPVPGGMSIETLATLARDLVALGPVAADLMEYNPLRDPGGAALARLRPFLEVLA